MNSFMDAVGVIAETTLLFYRNLIQAGATIEEASRLTQAFIAGSMSTCNSTEKSQEENEE